MSTVTHIWTDGAAPPLNCFGTPGGGIWWGASDHRTKGVVILGENTSLVAEVGAVLQAISDICTSSPGTYVIHTDLWNIVNFFNYITSGKSWESIRGQLQCRTTYRIEVKYKLFQAIKKCLATHKLKIVKAYWEESHHQCAHHIARGAMKPRGCNNSEYLRYVGNSPPLDLRLPGL